MTKEDIMYEVLAKQPLLVEIEQSEVVECMTIYAEIESIAFAEWMALNGIKVDFKKNDIIYWYKMEGAGHVTIGDTKQLYLKYKEETT